MKPASIWDWLGPFALMATFIAYLFLSTPSEIVLCRGDSNCFREWVGALSGWVAAGAAFFTVRTMIATQRQNVDIQLQRDMTLARLVRRRCSADKKRLETLSVLKGLSYPPTRTLSPEESSAFRKLRRSFEQKDFDEFEKIQFVGATYLRSVRNGLTLMDNALKLHQMNYEGKIVNNMLGDSDFDNATKTLERAEAHNKRLAKAANKFIKRWENQGISF